VRDAQRLPELERKLGAILGGAAPPRDPRERLDLANVCYLKRRHALASRLAADAFAADPRLAGDLQAQHRYKAACSAALAAAGQGEDAAALGDKERSALRGQALAWVRADQAAWARRLASATPKQRQDILERLRTWQQDPDLACVRDAKALATLPAGERDAWKKLWADVAELARKAEEKK
jgi:hypothetical protein